MSGRIKKEAKKFFQEVQLAQSEVEQAFKDMQNPISSENRDVTQQRYDNAKSVLNNLLERKAEGARIRSRINWDQKGEKINKYFFGLEKTRASNKTLRKLKCEDGTYTCDDKKISKEQYKFYKKLYSADDSVQFNIKNKYKVGLKQVDAEDLDAPFTFAEFTAALKTMAKGKAPGCDGLGPSFYVIFSRNYLCIGAIGNFLDNFCFLYGGVQRPRIKKLNEI